MKIISCLSGLLRLEETDGTESSYPGIQRDVFEKVKKLISSGKEKEAKELLKSYPCSKTPAFKHK